MCFCCYALFRYLKHFFLIWMINWNKKFPKFLFCTFLNSRDLGFSTKVLKKKPRGHDKIQRVSTKQPQYFGHRGRWHPKHAKVQWCMCTFRPCIFLLQKFMDIYVCACFSLIFLQKKNLHSHNMTPMSGGFSPILIGSRGFGEADSKMTSIFANSVERSTPPDQ